MRKKCLTLWLGIIAFAVLVWTAPALAQSRIEKTLKLGPGGRFELDSDAGSVTITGASQAGAKVVITSPRDDDLESLFSFNFEELAGLVRVTARKKFPSSWPRRLSLHYEVQVPRKTNLGVRTGGGSIRVCSIQGGTDLKTSGGALEISSVAGSVLAHTSGGSITLREVTGDARIDTSGGGIEVEALDGSLRGGTSGGPIRVRKVTGDIDVETSGGSIQVESAGGRVRADTSGGPVDVSFDRGNDRGGELSSSGGGIRVSLDPSVSLELDVSTSGGIVTADLPVKVVGRVSRSSLHGTLGSGGTLLKVHTSGGSIRIEGR